MSIFPIWNSTPGAYRPREASRLRKSQMSGPGRPGYVVMPCSMVWLRSTKVMRRGSPGLRAQLLRDAGQRADASDRLADLVVGRRGAGGDADDAAAGEPIGGRGLVLGADRLVTDRPGRRVHAFGVLDVKGAHALRLHQRGEVAGVARVVAAHDHHHVERL